MNILDNFANNLIVSAVTAAITFWGFWRREKAELEKEFSSRFNSKKWDVYTEFIKLAPQLINGNANEENIPTEIYSVDSLAAQIVLAGSDDVVTAFRIWREANETYEYGHEVIKEKLSRLIAQMRKDLGNKYTQLEVDDVIGALKPLS